LAAIARGHAVAKWRHSFEFNFAVVIVTSHGFVSGSTIAYASAAINWKGLSRTWTNNVVRVLSDPLRP
jgi:hypothetical protein